MATVKHKVCNKGCGRLVHMNQKTCRHCKKEMRLKLIKKVVERNVVKDTIEQFKVNEVNYRYGETL